jgi:hypothetical protein
MWSAVNNRYVLARESNVVRVDFTREPDPPAPKFPGGNALREIFNEQLAESFEAYTGLRIA